MTDLHEIVVDDVRKVISWEPVILQDHLIVHIFVIEDYFSVDDVFELGLALWHLHANDVGLSVRLFLLNLVL